MLHEYFKTANISYLIISGASFLIYLSMSYIHGMLLPHLSRVWAYVRMAYWLYQNTKEAKIKNKKKNEK